VVTAVASDAHGPDRPPSLTAAAALLRDDGIADPERYVSTAPRALLRDGIRFPLRARAA
jgi:hypothetical protein